MVLDVRIRICVLYEYKLNHPPAVAISNLNRAFGSEACSRRTVYRLYSRFRSGNEDLDDEEFMPIADDELMTAVEKEPEVSKSELARRFCVTRRTIRRRLNRIAGDKIKKPYDAKKAFERQQPIQAANLIESLSSSKEEEPSP